METLSLSTNSTSETVRLFWKTKLPVSKVPAVMLEAGTNPDPPSDVRSVVHTVVRTPFESVMFTSFSDAEHW